MASTGAMSARGNMKVPFLPGYSSNPLSETQGSLKKNQTLTYGLGGQHAKGVTGGMSGLPKLDLKQLESLMNPRNRYDMTKNSATHEEREAAKESARNTYRPALPPAWLKHDRQVLRFAAYFQEPVHENPKENFRVRHCTVFFYLEDGTMMVTEPRVENSGIPQGTFVKRHRIPKTEGSFFTYQDLGTAETIEIYARAFRIYDCDDFTRDFYENGLGTRLEPREEPPMDFFRDTQMREIDLLSQPTARDVLESKEYDNLAVGGSRKNQKLQQYLENDRKVLNFKAFWDDPTLYGSRMYFLLHYYLADDSIEIHEDLARNSGRDPYPVFWRRSLLRKNPHISPAPGMLEPEADLYKPEDLVVGETINVYNRDIYLYDCDSFTREFYRGYMSLEQTSHEIKAPAPVHVQLGHAPHTGIGTEEDSMASCLHLTPRPPRRDILKLMSEDGKVLRFEGKMVNGVAEDANRMFVVVMYLADDTVGIWEKRQRNSGHASGKFAYRSKMKNPATGDWFQPQDFFLGSTVEVNAVPFALVGADDATIVYMEENSHDFPLADTPVIVRKVQRIRAAIEKASQSGKAEHSVEEFYGIASAAGLDLCLHELLTLARNYGKQDGFNARGTITLPKLLAAL